MINALAFHDSATGLAQPDEPPRLLLRRPRAAMRIVAPLASPLATPLLALTLGLALPAGDAAAQQPQVRRQATPAATTDEAPPAPVSAEERRTLVDEIAKVLEERYVFEDKGREAGQHIQRLLAEGAFDDATDPRALANTLTEQLQSITHDKHMRVNAMRQRGPADGPGAAPGAAPGTVRRAGSPSADPSDRLLHMPPPPPPEGNYGFAKVESLTGNVGYLKIDGFASDPVARETAAAAMNFLAGHDALIIDLRENGGGNPSMVQFVCSYLFDQPTHLNSLYFREGDRTEEFWTLSDVPGKKLGQDVPVFVLTSNYTFSGGEEMAYNLQTQKRGTLIGETTGGGANPGGRHRVGDRFVVFVPGGRAINPVTGTNWEGVGVKPEIELPADEAYDKGLTLAQQAAQERRQAREASLAEVRREVVEQLREAAAAAMKDDPNHRSAELHKALERAVAQRALSEMEINLAGYDYMQAGQIEPALALLGFNVERFPDSPNVYDSFGEALEKAGRLEEAQAQYRKAHELGIDAGDPATELFKQNLDRVTAALAEKSRK